GRFEPHASHIGGTADPHQDLIDVKQLGTVQFEQFFSICVRHVSYRGAEVQFDAILLEALFQQGSRVGVIPWQNMRLFADQRNLGAEPGEYLRQFAADWAGANDSQPSRQFRQIEYGFIRQVSDLG